MRLAHWLLPISLGLLLGCENLPAHESFEVGMSRPYILDRFGEPDRKSELLKKDDRIWGAIETFWPRVPNGSAVEIWHYRSTAEWQANSGQRTHGTTEIYFVDQSEVISGLGFAPEGVVYEAQ